MSGIARLLMVAGLIWIGGYAYMNRDSLDDLRYPAGEPGWLCEQTAAGTPPRGPIEYGEDTILSQTDVLACLELDPAGFTHDHYYYYVRDLHREARRHIETGIAIPFGFVLLIGVIGWVAAGFRRRPVHG